MLILGSIFVRAALVLNFGRKQNSLILLSAGKKSRPTSCRGKVNKNPFSGAMEAKRVGKSVKGTVGVFFFYIPR